MEDQIYVGNLFPDMDDRKLLCLSIALENNANKDPSGKIIPEHMIENAVESIVGKGNMTNSLNDLEREI